MRHLRSDYIISALYNRGMKISTKTGDKGETGLFGGRRVSKSSALIEVLGNLDELQSLVGWARCAVEKQEFREILDKIQEDVYRMMSIFGFEMRCPQGIAPIGEEDVAALESVIEKYESADLRKFVRPGTTEAAARLHVVRSFCRRVERGIVAFGEKSETEQGNFCSAKILPAEIFKYINRLSDLLFVLAYSLEK